MMVKKIKKTDEQEKKPEKAKEEKIKSEKKKLEDYKKTNEEVEKIVEKAKKGEDISKVKDETEPEKKEDNSKKKSPEIKPELEREYIIPLRRKVQKVPRYKRAKKAIKVIREFLAKHMKVEERDLNKIKIDKWLNQEIWFRGIKKPPIKIKVKASKIEGIVKVELIDIPEKVKFDIAREEKLKEEVKKVKKTKVEKPVEEKKTEEEKEEEKEKEGAVVEAGLERQEQQAKEIKHTAKVSPRPEQQFKRKAMKR